MCLLHTIISDRKEKADENKTVFKVWKDDQSKERGRNKHQAVRKEYENVFLLQALGRIPEYYRGSLEVFHRGLQVSRLSPI